MKNFTPDIVEKLIVQNKKCFYCGFPMPLITNNVALKITRDRFYPKSKGGKNKKNIVLCHFACNQYKDDKDPTNEQIKQFHDFRHQLKRERSQDHAFYRDLSKFKKPISILPEGA